MKLLNEAIRSKDFSAAQKLIGSFLAKKLGKKVYPYPVPEEFTSTGSPAMVGVRFFISGGESVRFNWRSVGAMSRGLSSVDYWDGSKSPQPNPSHHIALNIEKSLVQVLPLIVDFVGGKIPTSGYYLQESTPVEHMPMVTDFSQYHLIAEASVSSGELQNTIVMVVKALNDGKTGAVQYKEGGSKKYGAGWNRVINTVQDTTPNLYRKEGRSSYVNADVAAKLDVKKILTALTGDADVVQYTVSPGRAETVEIEGTDDETAERMNYEEQLEALKTGMKLLLSNATNALFLGGRGGCLSGDTKLRLNVGTESFLDLKTKTEILIGSELEYNKFYDISSLNLETETQDGWVKIKSFVTKRCYGAKLKLETGVTIDCADTHLLLTEFGYVMANKLSVGDELVLGDGTRSKIAELELIDRLADYYDIEVDSVEHSYKTADNVVHHNTGKTQTVEDVLAASGRKDGDGYTKITGSATPTGIYRLLFQNRKEMLMFDDSDSALADQEGRNLFKAASDTKKIRKISWMKGGKNFVDPDDYDEDDEDSDVLPRSFEFSGKIIFISNLSLDKLDPDGALRTRGYVISIDPFNHEIWAFCRKIAHKIPLDVDYPLSLKERMECIDVLESRKMPEKTANLRQMVRAFNTRAGVEMQGGSAEEWKKFVKLFA